MRVHIPRWVQLGLIPVVAILGYVVARSMGHAILIFLMAGLIALLLNPVVVALKRLRIPRALSAAFVYLSFVAAVALVVVFAGPVLITQFNNLLSRLPEFEAGLRGWLGTLEGTLAARGFTVDLQDLVDQFGGWLGSISLFGTVFDVGVGLAGGLADFFMVIVISFYMLVDGSRIFRWLTRVWPGGKEKSAEYLTGLQWSFTRFVKGQTLLGVSVGLACGLGVWVLGWKVVNIWPEGSPYALLFGVWAGITELIPYVGPWIGALPAVILALFHSPGAALWVALIYLGVQQLENHILVPNIMGSTLRIHPLFVIFVVLAGAQIAGILGMLAVLPLMAMLRHTLDFYQFRLSRAPWIGDDGVAVLSMEVRSEGPAPGEAAHDPSRSTEL
ncbi:MAG: AI-2E family transporter [Gaiellales bacterium]|nr:AI-2E family transporter [Gaiellales bacterium]